MNLDYIPHLRKVLIRPLMTQESEEITSGVSKVMKVMEEYDLTKEDWDSIIEIGQFEVQRDPVASIPSKVCTCRSQKSLLMENLNSSKDSCGLL